MRSPFAIWRKTVLVLECNYIKPAGGKCGSPALKGKPHCYFHVPERLRAARRPKSRYFVELPVPTSRGSLLAVLRKVFNDLATERIEPDLAGRLIYALQLAICDRQAFPVRPLPSTTRGLRIFPSTHGPNLYTTLQE